jgi:hypothetical protein
MPPSTSQGTVAKDEQGIAPHTDIEFMTLVAQDDIGGHEPSNTQLFTFANNRSISKSSYPETIFE